MIIFYEIRNDWNDRTLCGLDLSWINDGRKTACFESGKEAEDAKMRYLIKEPNDEARLSIERVEFEPEE